MVIHFDPLYMILCCLFLCMLHYYFSITVLQLAVGTAVEDASSYVDLQITEMPFNVDPPEVSSATLSTEISYKDFVPETKVYS